MVVDMKRVHKMDGKICATIKGKHVCITENEFFNHPFLVKAYKHNIISVDNKERTLTIEDGIGNKFDLTWDFFVAHASREHKWTGDNLEPVFGGR